ncbi:hypothetical protein, partial [Salmonella enterica]|uniref:hypothetical protein n=1 Tax=Salmonella enterica TaxID=28901 RepID=UPI0011EC63E9
MSTTADAATREALLVITTTVDASMTFMELDPVMREAIWITQANSREEHANSCPSTKRRMLIRRRCSSREAAEPMTKSTTADIATREVLMATTKTADASMTFMELDPAMREAIWTTQVNSREEH